MLTIEQEITQIERQIHELKQKLKSLKKIRKSISIDLNENLSNFEDFPLSANMFFWISHKYNLYTVHDLIHSSREEILKMKGIGIKTTTKIEEWMSKHGLNFVTSE